MEVFEVFKWIAYIITGICGWFVKVLWDAQKEMRDDMKKIELNLSENYIKRPDFKDAIEGLKNDFKEMTQPLFKKLDRIEDYLMGKSKD